MPREFQAGAEEWDERFEWVGPCIGPRADAGDFPLERLTAQPALYVSLGTVAQGDQAFYTACFEAFGAAEAAERTVVLATGASAAPAGDLPENFLVRPSVPQLDVLERVEEFVTHGGMNSAMEALWHGVPMVVVPQQPEQAMTAARVAELGLGLALGPGAVSAAALRDAVAEVTGDPAYRARASAMQAVVRAAGGYERAASAILDFSEERLGQPGIRRS